MSSKCIIILFALMTSIIWVRESASASVSQVAIVNTSATNVSAKNSLETKVNDSSSGRAQKGLVATKESVTDIFACLGRRWYSNKDECYEIFLTFWNNYSGEDSHDDGISESKKSKKQLWNIKSLILGIGVKLILYLPIFAILTGKAISLSLASLLITSLAFLYNSQFNSPFFKRSDFN